MVRGSTVLGLLLVFFTSFSALAEELQAVVYQASLSAEKKQTYLLATGKDSAQLFYCHGQGTGTYFTGDFDSLIRFHCKPLLVPSATANSRMTNGVKNGKVLSLHVGGTEIPEAQALSLFSNAKSWLAIFSTDTEDSSSLLFTGVGIEIGAGLPRTDTVRVTFEKVASGALHGNYPLIPLKNQ